MPLAITGPQVCWNRTTNSRCGASGVDLGARERALRASCATTPRRPGRASATSWAARASACARTGELLAARARRRAPGRRGSGPSRRAAPRARAAARPGPRRASDAAEQPHQPVDLGQPAPGRRPAAWRSATMASRSCCSPDQLGEQVGQRLLARRVDEDLLHAQQGVVAGRARRSASRRAAARGPRGSSRPRPRRRRWRRRAGRGSHRDRPARQGGRSGTRRSCRRRNSSSSSRWVWSKTSASSTRTAASVVTSKKRR